MFAQVIKGKVADPGGIRGQWEKWQQEVKPGARGYLGSSGGVSDDGNFVLMARFEDEESARVNSARPEQGKWWEETSRYIDRAVFYDCREVDLILGGGSDDAGFIQVISGRVADREKVRQLGEQLEGRLREKRPDVIGGVVAWHDESSFTQLMYFSSESEARAAEANPDGEGPGGEWESLFSDLTYVDISEPWLGSS